MNLLRTEGQKKRKELTSIVRSVAKKEKKKINLVWDTECLNNQLSVASLRIGDKGSTLSLRTLNNEKTDCLNLGNFTAVDAVVYDLGYKAFAYKICAAMEERGYYTTIKEEKRGIIQKLE